MKSSRVAVVTTNRADWQHVVAMLNELVTEFDCTLVSIGNNVCVQDQDVIKWASLKKIEIISNSVSFPQENIADIVQQIPNTVKLLEGKIVDLVIIFGDRFEMLMTALWFYQLNIPIAHVAGGETSLGSLDDKYRDLITQVAKFHFPLTDDASKKLLSLGIPNKSIFRIGAPSLDLITDFNKINVEGVLLKHGVEFKNYVLMTYHAPTGDELEMDGLLNFYENLILALSSEVNLVITESNVESLGMNLREISKKFSNRQNRHTLKYLEGFNGNDYAKLLHGASLCLGNSSSGLYEAPLYKTPCINIGNRQQGRVHGPSVFDVPPDVQSVMNLVKKLTLIDAVNIDYSNPYYLPNSSNKLTSCLKQLNVATG